MNNKLCAYIEGSTSIIDLIKNATGLTSIYGKNIETVRLEYPLAEIVPLDFAIERINEALKEKYPMLVPIEITEEQFYDMFECLPPMQYVHGQKAMTFKMSEMTFGDITQGYVHMEESNKYYTMTVRLKTTHDEMVNVIK